MIKRIKNIISEKWLIIIIIFSVIGFIINTLLFYPGFMSSDSIAMLYASRGSTPSDVAPVMLGLTWRILYKLTGMTSSILLLQLSMLWSSLCIFSIYVFKRTGSKLCSLACLSVGVLPFVINISGVIWRDCQMTFSLMLAVSLSLFLKDIKNKKIKIALFIFIIFLALFAAVSRYNAIIAVVPLVFYFIRISHFIKKFRWQLAFSLLIIPIVFLILFPAINNIMSVIKSNNQPGLLLDDIIEVADINNLKEIKMPSDLRESLLDIKKCSIDNKVYVANIYACAELEDRATLYKNHSEFQRIWTNVVFGNPGNYVIYKLRMFVRILIPPEGWSYIWEDGIAKNDYNINVKYLKLKTLSYYYVYKFGYRYFRPMFEPLFWLLSGFVILYLSIKNKRGQYRLIINTLCVSSILYILGYIPTGATPDYRYFYWSVLAVLFAFIIFWMQKLNISSKNDIIANKTAIKMNSRNYQKDVKKIS